MTDLIERCNFTDLFPAWHFYFLCFLLFLFFLFLLSLFLLEFDSKIGKFQFDHIIHHFLNLIFHFGKNCLFYLLQLRFIFSTCLIFPFFGMFVYLLLHDQYCFSRTTFWIFFLEFIFFCQFLLLFTFPFLFLLCFS